MKRRVFSIYLVITLPPEVVLLHQVVDLEVRKPNILPVQSNVFDAICVAFVPS